MLASTHTLARTQAIATAQDLATTQRRENLQNCLEGQGKPSEPDDSRAVSVRGAGDTDVCNQIQHTEIHDNTAMVQQGLRHDLEYNLFGLD